MYSVVMPGIISGSHNPANRCRRGRCRLVPMSRAWRRAIAFVTGVASCLTAGVAAAQFGRRGFGGFRASFATAKDFDGRFHFCRIVYQSALNGDGGNWNADWPRADINLSIRLSELKIGRAHV